MPFTGSHPAAVLPFVRWLPPSALVIGSMTPDATFFVPVIPLGYVVAHSPLGVVTVDLAVGLVAFVVWQQVLAPTALRLAPRQVRARVTRTPAGLIWHFGSARRAVLVAAALVVGSITHIVWDAFTHNGRWGVRLLGVAAPHDAQRASSVVGALVLVVWCVRWWRSSGG